MRTLIIMCACLLCIPVLRAEDGVPTVENTQAFWNGTYVNEQGETVRAMDTLFDMFHFAGKAKSVKVHYVVFHIFRNGESVSVTNWGTAVGFFTKLTLYWQGPLVQNGYSDVLVVYSKEKNEYTFNMLQTNGTTNEEAGFITGYILGTILFGNE